MTGEAAFLDDYLVRIGHDGAGGADLATLSALHRCHAAAIPFENLDVLCGRPVSLDPGEIQAKLVGRRRGGYCFEQNALFARVLRAFGFHVSGLAARVRWGVPAEVETPRTHMLLRVDLDEGPMIADVGFGGLTLTEPLRLAADVTQQTSHEPFRLAGDNGAFILQACLAGEWASLYRFTLEPAVPADYLVANWYTSSHPRSLFVANLLAARPDEGVRYALNNLTFTIRRRGEAPEVRQLAGVDALVAVLERHFGVTVTDPEDRRRLAAHADRWAQG